jgi:hypothetical protein
MNGFLPEGLDAAPLRFRERKALRIEVDPRGEDQEFVLF